MNKFVRLINASRKDFAAMNSSDLKESIYQSEGRVIMDQHLLFAGPGNIRRVTNTE